MAERRLSRLERRLRLGKASLTAECVAGERINVNTPYPRCVTTAAVGREPRQTRWSCADGGRGCRLENASRASWPWSVVVPTTPLATGTRWMPARLRKRACSQGLAVSPPPRLHTRRVRTWPSPPMSSGPIGTRSDGRNDASGDRFVRRPPLATRCPTTTFAERATGLEPVTSSLGSWHSTN
jgi:hypothetical protein